jgi:hypothetical protein
MQRISKPHLVDLLRVFDKKRWITPRIRYASVRSKPELIADLRKHFTVCYEGDLPSLLEFLPRESHRPALPTIEYCLKRRKYLFDGNLFDVPKESREQLRFRISRRTLVVTFPQFP